MILNELKRELRSLSGLLTNWGRNVKNPILLQNLNFTQKGNKIVYSIEESSPLTFINLDLDSHCRPMGIEKIHKDNIDVKINLTTNYIECTNTDDPIESLGVNIIVAIEYINSTNEYKSANCSWHLDKGAPSGSIFSHPIYHMNFGGSAMTKQGDVFGNLLLLPAPRIVHPPMDIILSCDFIIRNFYSKKNHSSLTNTPAYQTLIKKAKLRYWKPYSTAFAAEWHDSLSTKNLTHNAIIGH